jgi:nucleotide-binding universal stress UspA family protein
VQWVPRLGRFLPLVQYGDEIAYRHLLVAYDGTPEGEEAVLAAGLLAERDRARLTIAAVVELERHSRWATRWSRGTGVWNDVILDQARADLEHAARLASVAAELTVLVGTPDRALPEAVDELGCDAIMLPPRPRSRVKRLLRRDRVAAIRRRTSCEVVQPR